MEWDEMDEQAERDSEAIQKANEEKIKKPSSKFSAKRKGKGTGAGLDAEIKRGGKKSV